MTKFIVGLIFIGALLTLSGAEGDNKIICQKKDEKIKLDGRLDEPVWKNKMAADKFYKSKKRGLAQYQTEVYITYDDENLYIGATMYDEDIVANYKHRDDPIYNEDVFEVFMRPDLTKNFIYEFEFSPTGVIFDGLDRRGLPSSSGYNVETRKAWNAEGIECAIYMDGTLNDWSDKDKYWSVEIKIPLKNFAFRNISEIPRKGTVWMIVFARCESSAYLEQRESSASIPLEQYGGWENYSEWKQLEFK